jgi:hypothetical protein
MPTESTFSPDSVTVAVLEAVTEFASAVIVRVPLPVPAAGEMVSQAAALSAFHATEEVTAAVEEAPPAAKETEAGETESVAADFGGMVQEKKSEARNKARGSLRSFMVKVGPLMQRCFEVGLLQLVDEMRRGCMDSTPLLAESISRTGTTGHP